MRTSPNPGRTPDTETLYARAEPGVVVVGGIFRCKQCHHWHAQCASGFVVPIIDALVSCRLLQDVRSCYTPVSEGRRIP